jgi:acyl-CoA synthetase (AMP-forming)/AMP-acid ligase II
MSGNNTIGILQKLHQFATETPEKKVWTFLNDKGEPNDSYTFKELEVATDYVCDYLLTSCKVKKGDRILLVFFPGLDFMAALLACFKAELIAVPVFPPDPRRLKKDLHHFISIQRSSEAVVALTNSQYNFVKKVEDIKNIFSSEKWPDIRWILVDDQLKKGRTNNKLPSKLSFPTIQSIAFLQYTSGSTSEPKGVMISHENLAHNLSLIIHELKADQSTVNISWLPQYHDMGLIGSYLGVLYCGGEGYYLSPISFLKEPMVWIRTLSKYRATHTQVSYSFALH